MVDLDDVRARPEEYQKAADNKGIGISIEGFLKLDELRKELIPLVDDMRARQNSVSKKIPTMKDAEKKTALADMKKLSADLKKKEKELNETETSWKDLQLSLPTIPLDNVPVGKDDTENVEVRKEGDVPGFGFKVKDHMELGEALDIVDIPRGVKLAGARFYFLKGDGARLEQAVLRLAMDHLVKKGYTLFSPPLMTSWDCFMGTGFFPGWEDNAYAVGPEREKGGPIENEDHYLIGTSEISVCSYHKDEVLPKDMLPTRYAGVSPCFRRESGTYGKDTHGLYRVHQFQKIEQVILCEANQEEGMKMFEEIRTNAEDVLQMLELPYRVVDVCTGDMGQGKVFMQDIESWMPSREGYCETHSCSYLGDFQARRLNIRYEDEEPGRRSPKGEGGKKFCHTLNNTCIATPRILIPLLENYQNEDGSVTIPKALRPYMDGQEKIEVR